MKVLVCGGRDYENEVYVWDTLTGMATRGWVLINGMCPTGVDKFAREWARKWKLPIEEYFPDWEKHGKAAGPIRNKQMLDEGKPDLVVAFPGGKGTANMVKQAKEAGVEVIIVK